MTELTKEEFKRMYENHKAKESAINEDLNKLESERMTLQQSVKSRIEFLD